MGKRNLGEELNKTLEDYRCGLVANLTSLHNWSVALNLRGELSNAEYLQFLYALRATFSTLADYIVEKVDNYATPTVRAAPRRHKSKAITNKKVLARKHTRTNSPRATGAVR